jgi:glycine cleavage system H protein
MSNLKYTDDHEWVRIDGDDVVTVGITNFAQEQLGELVFVELPAVDSDVSQGDEAAVIESVKAAGEVKSPVTGTIIEVNDALPDSPELVNEDPTGAGWFYNVKMADPAELEGLKDQDAYQSYIETLE